MSTGYVNKAASVGDSAVNIASPDKAGITFNKGGKTKLEKGLIFLAIILLLAVIGLIIALVITSKKEDAETEDQEPEICETPECTIAAAQLLRSMDLTVDPCDDFYMYACGTWKDKTVIPEDRSSYEMLNVLEEDVQVVNKYHLEDTKSYTNIEAVIKARDLYASCIDLNAIDAGNVSVATRLLEELGGWPVLGSNTGGNWIEAAFDLPKLLVSLIKYNVKPLISLSVHADFKDTENNIIYLYQPSLVLPSRLYYLNPSLENMREAYVTLATSIATLLGADQVTAEKDMRDMLALETDIANISMKPEEQADKELMYNKMTISDLKLNFTEPNSTDPVQFDWLEYLQAAFDINNVKIPINESEELVVAAVPYFQQLFNVLQKHDKRVVANYVLWIVTKTVSINLDSRFRDLFTEYHKVVYGLKQNAARWSDCETFTTSTFDMAVGHMLVKETFDESAKSEALEMVSGIRSAFNELLDEIDWMDEATKALAKEKAHAIGEWIGYSNDVLDITKVNKRYENLVIDRNDYFKNDLSIMQWGIVEEIGKLRDKVDKKRWITGPSTVNAYYHPLFNVIVFPAGILQPIFYMKGQPKSMNYGGIGYVIGHELTHGFDNTGRQFDKDGNLKQWWDPKVIANFKEKAQCLVNQYSNFTVPEANMNVNGLLTLGENIADNGGLKQSFRAYRKWVAKQGKEEPKLPGVDFTNNQLFFINFAQVWCGNSRKESLIHALTIDKHSPKRFRIIGTLQNSVDFSKAFGCTRNGYMNPDKKCYVW